LSSFLVGSKILRHSRKKKKKNRSHSGLPHSVRSGSPHRCVAVELLALLVHGARAVPFGLPLSLAALPLRSDPKALLLNLRPDPLADWSEVGKERTCDFGEELLQRPKFNQKNTLLPFSALKKYKQIMLRRESSRKRGPLLISWTSLCVATPGGRVSVQSESPSRPNGPWEEDRERMRFSIRFIRFFP